ncbi:hypothetical protein M0R45_006493 [Rubus argutus]|uniref:Uncharacterized protein n=1 Tax=Rubus argutus TaxID=59490 RepID=A0AAW1YQR7_RUBAR
MGLATEGIDGGATRQGSSSYARALIPSWRRRLWCRGSGDERARVGGDGDEDNHGVVFCRYWQRRKLWNGELSKLWLNGTVSRGWDCSGYGL